MVSSRYGVGSREVSPRAKARGTADEVQRTVRYGEAGFNVEGANRSRVLELVSMQERVHLVDGKFHVGSRPKAGTKIVAVVPCSLAGPSLRSTKIAHGSAKMPERHETDPKSIFICDYSPYENDALHSRRSYALNRTSSQFCFVDTAYVTRMPLRKRGARNWR